MQTNVVVSVCMITYGHEKYIKQAIEGVLNQKTTFEIELIISNDCSPDESHTIINEIISSHKKGGLIKYHNQKQNLGMHANFIFALKHTKGKYIALCEGDDYWTDPMKLQKQVDFMTANPDYELCFTNIKIVNHNDEEVKEQLINDNRKTTYLHKDMPIWAPTLTRLFKNRNFDEILKTAPGLDVIMLLYQSKFGKVKFLNEVTGNYRLHDEGIYSSKSKVLQKQHIIETHFESLKIIDQDLLPKYFGMIFKKLLDIKALDLLLFKKNKILTKEYFRLYKNSLSSYDRQKIFLGMFLIDLPIVSHSEGINKFIYKIINRLLIY